LSCRLAQTDLPLDEPKLSRLDNAKADNLKKLEDLANKLLEGPVSDIDFETGELVPSKSFGKNKEALKR